MKSRLREILSRLRQMLKKSYPNNHHQALSIIPYYSYANQKQAIIRGRVIEDMMLVAKEHNSRWENFQNNLKRMTIDKAKACPVKLVFQDTTYHCLTDDHGFFSFDIPVLPTSSEFTGLVILEATLSISQEPNDTANKTVLVSIVKPPTVAKFGIITDIDDTILQSHVDSFLKLRLLYETFFKNAAERKPFENIGGVLTRLIRNEKGIEQNPIFYISHSPWNLYGPLHNFFTKNQIPMGPFFLRDFEAKWSDKKYEYEHHKLVSISHLCELYESLPFILIGDATENDIDIYTQIARKYPTRILHIIIRATENEQHNIRVKQIIAQHDDLSIHLIHHSEEIINIIFPASTSSIPSL